jgi:hypothetical protein
MRLGSWSVLPDDAGFGREVRCSAALDVLPEQPHPILSLRANHLAFRAKSNRLLARHPSLSIMVMGDEAARAKVLGF